MHFDGGGAGRIPGQRGDAQPAAVAHLDGVRGCPDIAAARRGTGEGLRSRVKVRAGVWELGINRMGYTILETRRSGEREGVIAIADASIQQILAELVSGNRSDQ